MGVRFKAPQDHRTDPNHWELVSFMGGVLGGGSTPLSKRDPRSAILRESCASHFFSGESGSLLGELHPSSSFLVPKQPGNLCHSFVSQLVRVQGFGAGVQITFVHRIPPHKMVSPEKGSNFFCHQGHWEVGAGRRDYGHTVPTTFALIG